MIRSVRKLASADLDHVHVVTDHGFFLRDDPPADAIDKLQIVFYSDPPNAAFRAMGLE